MNYPRHIALIPDGNRTRARENDYSKYVGHIQGFKRVNEIIHYLFSETPVEVFTVWGLSTENLRKRDDEELEYLFELYKTVPESLESFLKENEINFRVVGSNEGLPQHLIDFLDNKVKELDFGSEKSIILALNYGGRNEIVRGVNNLFKDEKRKTVDEETLSKYMDLGKYPNVEMVVRTKGDIATRLSGFMLWRIGYAELFFSSCKCPELNVSQLERALEWFNQICINRNFGK